MTEVSRRNSSIVFGVRSGNGALPLGVTGI